MSDSTMIFKDSWIVNALMENTNDSVYIKDRQCRLWRVNKKMAADLGITDITRIYGKTEDEVFGEESGGKTVQEDNLVMESGQARASLVKSIVSRDGRSNWSSSSKTPLRNEEGEVIGLLGILHEIRELKDAETDFRWLATHDTLTSLANRFLLTDRIEQAIFHARRNHCLFAVLTFRLIDFDRVHKKQDYFLKKIASTLTRNVRSSDTVARLDDEQFAVLLDGLNQAEEGKRVAEKLKLILYNEVDPEGHLVEAAVSVSTYPVDGEEPEKILQASEKAVSQRQ